MAETIGLIIVFLFGASLFYKAYEIKNRQRLVFRKPSNVKEWHDIKYGNGFIVLHWTELEKWDKASVKEKCELINYQQKLIKKGLVRIVREDGERRLVTNYEYKSKNDRQAKN